MVLETATTQFHAIGYQVTKNVMAPDTLSLIETYCHLISNAENGFIKDRTWPIAASTTLGKYSDLLGESILLNLQPKIEAVVGRKLLPTYSYMRNYGRDSVLVRHRDRSSCEVSASVTIAYHADQLWPLCIETAEGDKEIFLDKGDMLVYKGCEVTHWRESFQGKSWLQIFIHYVYADGDLSMFKYDTRKAIGGKPAANRMKWEEYKLERRRKLGANPSLLDKIAHYRFFLKKLV